MTSSGPMSLPKILIGPSFSVWRFIENAFPTSVGKKSFAAVGIQT